MILLYYQCVLFLSKLITKSKSNKQIPKKQVDGLLAELHTDDKGLVCWKDDVFVVKGKGHCSSPHLNAKVK